MENRSCSTFGCRGEERTPFGGVCQKCAEKELRRVIKSRIVNYTCGGNDAQIEAVFDRIVATGECILHAAAMVFGKRCHCFECESRAPVEWGSIIRTLPGSKKAVDRIQKLK
jgi:hypothetical protein